MAEFNKELERMSPLEPRLLLKNQGLLTVVPKKQKKTKAGPSRHEETQQGGAEGSQDIDKLIKVEKWLFIYNRVLDFIHGSIKAFG